MFIIFKVFASLTVDCLRPEGTLKLKWNFSQNGFFLVLTYEINNGCIRVTQVPA